MTKGEFLRQLKKSLRQLPKNEIEKSLLYYREMIEDRMEEGLGEEEAVAEFEDVQIIANGILKEFNIQPSKLKYDRFLLSSCVLFPLWLLACFIWSICASSLIFAIFTCLLSLFLCGPMALAAFFGIILSNMHGILLLGVGAICSGLGLILWVPGCKAAKWLAHSIKKLYGQSPLSRQKRTSQGEEKI